MSILPMWTSSGSSQETFCHEGDQDHVVCGESTPETFYLFTYKLGHLGDMFCVLRCKNTRRDKREGGDRKIERSVGDEAAWGYQCCRVNEENCYQQAMASRSSVTR